MRTHHGFFDTTPGSMESVAVLEAIRAFRPHILLVCMGMPRQEYWIQDNWERIHANAVLPMGAALDYWAGVIPTPPRWMGRMGLEWLCRLLSEPRRLWRRYLVEPWALLVPLAAALLRLMRRLPSSKRTG
jgi:N-acetylglucosaminyldiphosphoundecaprenol N-acetyl-beta-D-mannosaminyltransferase